MRVWSLAAGLQELAANHRKRRWLRASVVSVTEKVQRNASGVDQEDERKCTTAHVSKVYIRCQNRGGDVAPG